MRKLSILLLFVLLLNNINVAISRSTDESQKPLPLNKEVRFGKLANGLTYYIQHNTKPENRVEFRLAVNAGSNQEEVTQKGLAHFVEHMAFNGTNNFKNAIVLICYVSEGMISFKYKGQYNSNGVFCGSFKVKNEKQRVKNENF